MSETYDYHRRGDPTAWTVGVIVALGLLAIAYLVFAANTQPSTGPKETFGVYTDELTGCQYIARTAYDLEPRMNAEGKQVCLPPKP